MVLLGACNGKMVALDANGDNGIEKSRQKYLFRTAPTEEIDSTHFTQAIYYMLGNPGRAFSLPADNLHNLCNLT